eukprot:84769-Prymnesium_polylepis.2
MGPIVRAPTPAAVPPRRWQRYVNRAGASGRRASARRFRLFGHGCLRCAIANDGQLRRVSACHCACRLISWQRGSTRSRTPQGVHEDS